MTTTTTTKIFFCFASEQCKMKWKTFFKNYKPFDFSFLSFSEYTGIWLGSTVVRFVFAANLIHHAHELLFFVIPPEGGEGGVAWRTVGGLSKSTEQTRLSAESDKSFFCRCFCAVYKIYLYIKPKYKCANNPCSLLPLRPWTEPRLHSFHSVFPCQSFPPSLSLSVSLRSVCLPKWRHVCASNWRVASTHTTDTHTT